MSASMTPTLMFANDQHGHAEAALELWISAFPNSSLGWINRWEEGAGEETPGTVMQAEAVIAGVPVRVMDSAHAHQFGFSPAHSYTVECDTEEEVDHAWSTLTEGGQVLMELGEYPFSPKFGWCADRYGINWQISVPMERGQDAEDRADSQAHA
ncbi:VOC family protein [Kocuria sp.]|uniref:VOC family protein n=1 Tax=Kocuria sp. TaxID=1871328 RepID=UPI0026E0851C|nr:VOC family protein [Kocuria sp.]MDO5617214.1 VOC family protein [Kocuria sp.]